jgi:uncharacterized membrane protein YvlD (DUF360 family)
VAASPRRSRLSTVIVVLLLDWAALGLTIRLLPGISATTGWAVLLAAAVLGLLGAAVRPAMAVLLTRIGWAGVFGGWLLSQALLLYLTLSTTPGLQVDGFWAAFWASWLYAVVVSIGLWFITAGQPAMVTRHLLRVNRRYRRAAPACDAPGVVMIQVDGLSAPLARWAIASGSLPTCSCGGLSNVLLRHLNLSIVAEHMMRGAPSIYCDFVDYDEIAHHAGPARPEALAALEGIDGVLATLEELAPAAPRPYHFVVVSDHGQSQGATFGRRYGVELEELVRELTDAPGSGVVGTREDEQAGRARTLRAGLLRRPDRAGSGPPAAADRPEIVVAASGNLALLYLARHPGRLTMEDIEERHPELLAGLVAHPGIGWVAVRSRLFGPVVLGAAGRRYLTADVREGQDPLIGFGRAAADDLRRHDALPHVGDILVNSMVDPVTQEVAAFEDLVGCHGGLGGWQNRPVLIHPAAWQVETELIGADAVHRQLVSWLENLGQRAHLREPTRRGGAAV